MSKKIKFKAWDKKYKQWVNITQMNFDDKGRLVYVYASANLYGKIDHPLTELEIIRHIDPRGKESKLDTILDEMNMANPGGELIAQEEAKQQFKELMREIFVDSEGVEHTFRQKVEKL